MVSPVCIDDYKADRHDIDMGHYQFWNIEHAYTKGPAAGLAKALLEYVESDQVQTRDLPAFNLYQLTAIQTSALQSHREPRAPAPESFYSNQHT
jgi:phosphate transport system substrate-binding protein